MRKSKAKIVDEYLTAQYLVACGAYLEDKTIMNNILTLISNSFSARSYLLLNEYYHTLRIKNKLSIFIDFFYKSNNIVVVFGGKRQLFYYSESYLTLFCILCIESIFKNEHIVIYADGVRIYEINVAF